MTDNSGLEGAYSVTLSRIKRQDREKSRLGMAALMWISHSERPLEVNELCYALGVEIGSVDLDEDKVPSIGTVLACCQGLVAVDKEASTVRLIHFTLQEYLQAHPELFDSPHSTMAEICLSYLNSDQVKALSGSHFGDTWSISSPEDSPSEWGDTLLCSDAPFLNYSSLYWGRHASRNLSDCAKKLALKLFDDCSNRISTRVLIATKERPYCIFSHPNEFFLFSSLHYASFSGIVEIMVHLVEVEGCDINQIDSAGHTPLTWAACSGNEGAVKTLLGWGGINPDQSDHLGRTPFTWAAFGGREGVVKILLERDDANPDQPDDEGTTPLCWAALRGHEGVVKTLLGQDGVNPNTLDTRGRTPLFWAVINRQERVIEILLGRDDVNPNKPDIYGRTPLCLAALNGFEGIVKILLGRGDIIPDQPDDEGTTPLCLAALGGREGAVKTLLGQDGVNPNKPDIYGRTPLCLAAFNGFEGIVKILLGRGDVNPDKPDNDGQTPLFCAIDRGHAGVVALLQSRASAAPSTA